MKGHTAVWTKELNADPLPWLLEPDPSCPGVRYFALTELLDEPATGAKARAARREVMKSGPVPEILARQRPDGSWSDRPYADKYTGTVWAVTSLWQIGADPPDARVTLACDYVLGHAVGPAGAFVANGLSMFIHCLSGNLSAALIALGSADDPTLQKAVEAMARMVTGEGVQPKRSRQAGKAVPADALRYMASGTPGPGFQCASNGGLACGWGAARVLIALASVPKTARSPLVERALDQTVEFLLSRDPAVADYPTATNVNSSWQKFGFPLFYITDYLSVLEGLALAGRINDPRASNAVAALVAKQDGEGQWSREHAPRSPVGFKPGKLGEPNKWVTLRALRVLKAAHG